MELPAILHIEKREGIEFAPEDNRLHRRTDRWFIVDDRGSVVAPGLEGYRNELIAREALRAMQKLTNPN